jgi:hypothetical protein
MITVDQLTFSEQAIDHMQRDDKWSGPIKAAPKKQNKPLKNHHPGQ